MDKYFKHILIQKRPNHLCEKKKKKSMNQVRVTSPTSLTSFQLIFDLMTCICGSCLMSFAHQTPHDVRFMYRFALHDSHHMASTSRFIGIDVHYIYHMVVSFLTPSEAACLLRSRGVLC